MAPRWRPTPLISRLAVFCLSASLCVRLSGGLSAAVNVLRDGLWSNVATMCNSVASNTLTHTTHQPHRTLCTTHTDPTLLPPVHHKTRTIYSVHIIEPTNRT
mmetsp:Transcript_21997/g.61218  ORF Transcript_21997/g.61218 Transcript_21997/m.61218 type:complete len:102 (+) Transcript_21997:1046-1351(+)